MKAKPARVVLAIFSAKEEEPEKAYQALKGLRQTRVALLRQDGSSLGDAVDVRRYAPLRLQGESFLIVKCPPSGVPIVIKHLRAAGAPTVFVQREDLGTADDTPANHWRSATGQSSVLARLKENQVVLEAARSDLLEAARLDHALTAAAEWILDNGYLIRTQVAEVRRHLPRDYPKGLPAQDSSEFGHPRSYELAHGLVIRSDFSVDENNIVEHLADYQKRQPLTVAELWLFPLLLRIALLEGLTGLAVRVHRAQQLREAAYLWANRLAAASQQDSATFDRMLGLLESEPFALQPYFVTALAEQLQGEESALAPVQHWVEDRLRTRFPELVRQEHIRESSERLSVANAFGSLRALSRIDFTEIFEAVSVVEAELRSDPGDIYPKSDFTTRDRCRRVVERIAHNAGLEEYEVARRAVRLAGTADDPRHGHVAYYLLADGVTELELDTRARVSFHINLLRLLRRHATPLYLTAIAVLTAGLLAISLAMAWDGGVHSRVLIAVLGILSIFPLSELSIQIVNALVISLLPPDSLPKMSFRNGIPEEDATLVVVPMLLSSVETARREVEKLEVRFLANPDAQIFFSLFSDFTDNLEETAPTDAEVFATVRDGIQGLNTRHPGGRFLLFHRPRVWSEGEQVWMGRERKRGKIDELNAYLCGEGPGDILVTGELPVPIRYVITLDSDTQLPPGTARRLIETISHPLNHAEIDPPTGLRKSGFAMIQPRVSIALPGATATRFTRIFADTSGTDPYCESVSDAHQDLFGEAAFHGKAIYDVRAFRAAVGDRFPAETILSHDLIEGAHAGVALATDIELFETIPLDYAGYSKREHRWIRGDWQIAPWILPRVPGPDGNPVPNRLSPINRWRIFDNLRRSLVPVASLWLLLFGWLISGAPGVWSLVVGLAVVIPALAPLLERLARRLQGKVHRWQGAEAEFVRTLVVIAFLPHQAWIAMDAIVRVIHRRFVSHRHLLEWQPAEVSEVTHGTAVFRQLLIIGGGSILLMLWKGVDGALLPTIVFLGPWIAAPPLMRWLERPAPLSARRRLSKVDTGYLRRLSRRTWRFFDDLVGPESNWLPPDNTQLALRVEVAQRTSPTNIGLWLTSALAATDFGYLTPDQFLERTEHTMTTLDKLERYEGHLLNWYDTATLQPLRPRYVSTVDSGNLLASCWVVARGCYDLLRRPVIGQVCLRGLSDTQSVVQEESGSDVSLSAPLRQLRRLLRGPIEGYELMSQLAVGQSSWPVPDRPGGLSYWPSHMRNELDAWSAVAQKYLAWMRTLAQPPDSFLTGLGPDAANLRKQALQIAPSLIDLAGEGCDAMRTLLERRGKPGLTSEVSSWLDQLVAEFQQAREQAAETSGRLIGLADRMEQLANGINMRFLYDNNRRLFGVGYPVGGPLQFSSHYDLLASESRLASMVAIAKGDVPVEHWFTLGRPRVMLPGGKQALLSWSGTMFEYLMPVLFMRLYDNSLLDLACRESVWQQIEYGRENQVPWGISESAYSALDAHQIYQYRAFGIPTLALKAGMEEDLVVAPYATVLALMIDPVEAVENLRRLETFDLAGPMGFYESIDFGIESQKGGERGVPVQAYMAHHQGMSLMALDEVLHREVMKHRFHSDVRIRAIEPLLFEGVPIACPPADEIHSAVAPVRTQPEEESAERAWKEDTLVPRVHLQSNGRYAVMLTNAGGGYSRWHDFDVTRWRSDATADCWGSFLYIRDLKSGNIWSAAHQPVPAEGGETSVRFSADRAEFQRRFFGIETILAIAVAPEDDVELRRLTITNRSLRSRELEFTSYIELAMAPHRSDTSHPAFNKMFVQTESLDAGALLARRRPRDPSDTPIWTAHVLLGETDSLQFETDRARFLGRARTPAFPSALGGDLSGSAGTVLDPAFSLRCRMTLEPRDRREITFITLAAATREALLELIEKYRRPEAVSRAFEMAWTRAQLEFRYLGIGPAAAHRYQELAGYLLFPSAALRLAGDRLVQTKLGQSTLWAYGISGDVPVLTVAISSERHLPLVREVLLAHTYWRLRGLKADLLVLNQENPDYERPLHQHLDRQIEAHSAETGRDRPGGVFLRDWYSIPEEHRNLILASSSIVLSGTRGPLQQQMPSPSEKPLMAPFVPSGGHEEPSAPLPFLELPYFNGIGGFTPDGSEYAIYLKDGSTTPRPWVNVFATPNFGTMVSESGLGFTWCGNSQANRLTPWHNDPVGDPQSEAIYIRDAATGALWTPTALPIREHDAYRARHGQGYTVYEHNSHAIEQELTVFVPMNDDNGDPVKICRLRLRNSSSSTRRLTITYYAEWVLGSVREDQQMHVRVSRDEASGALLATQTWSGDYQSRIAFAAASPRASSWSGDRAQFVGRDGRLEHPAALDRVRLDNRTGANLDPGAALQLDLNLPAGRQDEVIFLLGEAESIEGLREIVGRYQTARSVEEALGTTRRWWDARLGTIHVRTPVLSTDFLLNRWLLYQSLSCRFWGRSALYQSSGAFGFRDQLQDAMALVYAAPDLARQHILRAAARQFLEGDVQHWWHSETGNGVRTLCSDDLVWLPYVTAQYVNVTGDTAILDVPAPFIEGPELKPGEHERMFIPVVSSQTAPLWEHCRLAFERAWRLGEHGLPLIGSCDWNDGMNRVGTEGRGESVWLAWFLYAAVKSFSQVKETGQTNRLPQLAAAIERYCWDGAWYLRAFFDNGAPLGSHANTEARIDSLAQSWAVLSAAGDPVRARTAMDSAERYLVEERNRLVLLFTPPFDHSEPHPGYIMGYPPGLRENGGQYTHGSLWMAQAWARLGEGDSAVRLLNLMNPVEHSRSPAMLEQYRGEPYVVAADVYAAPGRIGECGWTWYTGSAGWMYRIWLEEVLGFRLRGDRLEITPSIPGNWDGFEIRYRYRSTIYEIEVRRSEDDAPLVNPAVQLVDDGDVHKVTVWLPKKAFSTPAGTNGSGKTRERAVADISTVTQRAS